MSHEDNPEERAREAADHCTLAADKLHHWQRGDDELESASKHVAHALRALADVLEGIERHREKLAEERRLDRYDSWGEDA